MRVRAPLPGLYNIYNALAAAALSLALGVPLEEVAAGLGAVRERRSGASSGSRSATGAC